VRLGVDFPLHRKEIRPVQAAGTGIGQNEGSRSSDPAPERISGAQATLTRLLLREAPERSEGPSVYQYFRASYPLATRIGTAYHAHFLLGAAEIVTKSGTNVKTRS
jgi:hypothetical protein